MRQFNDYWNVFDLLWLRKICGAESAQCSEQLFRQKNALGKKTAEIPKPLRFMWPKDTLKVEETNFQTGTKWYFFVDLT